MSYAQLTPELIVDLILDPAPTLEICTNHGLAISELLELVRGDDYHRIESELDEIERIRAAAFRRKLRSTLEQIAAQTPESRTHSETIRKATALLLRLTGPTPPQEESAPGQPEPPDPPPDNPGTHPGDGDDGSKGPSAPVAPSTPGARMRGKAAQCARDTTSSIPPITPQALTAAAGRAISVYQLIPTKLDPRPPPPNGPRVPRFVRAQPGKPCPPNNLGVHLSAPTHLHP